MLGQGVTLLAVFGFAFAADLSGGNPGTNVELSHGYHVSGLSDTNLKPSGNAYMYVGGKLTQIAPDQFAPPDSSALSSLGYGIGMNELAATGYFAAGAIAALSVWYVISAFALPASKKVLEDLKDSINHVEEEATETEEDAKEDVDKTKKSRRRRALNLNNEELTALATIVLNAVRSGECMQKTICLVGKQASDRKGKFADALLTTLLPVSVQESDYFVTLKKSLRGEMNCNRFRCSAE